jgi:hypothetical protein
MPLSEDEQRILSEIEQRLYESDPALVRSVGKTTVYTHSVRQLKWSALAFVVGVVIMVLALSTSFLASFGGFLVMLCSALWFERHARKLGRVGMQQATSRIRGGGGIRDSFGSTGQRMKDRFKRGDEE